MACKFYLLILWGRITGVDFNPRAIKFAQKTASVMGVDTKFVQSDLFTYEGDWADIVISNGVLHHTSDCMGGIRKCIDLTKPGGKVFIGLYHKYGRKSFLNHFKDLKNKGLGEKELFEEYKKLDRRFTDETQAYSWFLDQVMYPYETQHTLKEVYEVFIENNVNVELTSINDYKKLMI